jgi:hypothetical protein
MRRATRRKISRPHRGPNPRRANRPGDRAGIRARGTRIGPERDQGGTSYTPSSLFQTSATRFTTRDQYGRQPARLRRGRSDFTKGRHAEQFQRWLYRFASQGSADLAKRKYDPGGTHPCPRCRFYLFPRSSKAYQVGTEGRARQHLSGPREVETLGSGGGPLDGSRILPTQTINCSIAEAYSEYNHEL